MENINKEKTILNNRYELLEEIGSGGMAHVFKARCRVLNRFVAIKMLKEEFVNDEEFVNRFRVEAQAAASLSHPNIVSIYDVLQKSNNHYIVMEYIDGITLKEYIEQKGKLDWKEAVNIAIQICSAIEHAHKNRIIHRDIKPHNIILTKDKIAKVTDFGIARATTSSTITMGGHTIGSVHYISPEQARGGYTDEKSDLYSLGIVIYEMVTGELPFEDENPVAVALKHIQVEPKEPIAIDFKLPFGLNDIIMNAITKDQTKRYQTAADMLNHLYLILKAPHSNYKIISNHDFETRKIPIINENNSDEVKLDLIGNTNPKNTNKREKKTKTDNLTMWLAIATSIIIMAILIVVAFNVILPTLGLFKNESQDFTVADYIGRNYVEVQNELASQDINVNIIKKNSDTVEKDLIIDQNKAKGEKIKKGGYSFLEFQVSTGPKTYKVLSLKNLDSREAETMLTDKGLKYETIEEYNDVVATGIVIRTDPDSDTEITKDKTIKIYKSKGPEEKFSIIPNLIGKTRLEALKILENENLTLGKVLPDNTSNIIDAIIKQDPNANTKAKQGYPVNIYFEEKKIPTKQIIRETIELEDATKYGDDIRVMIEATPSDTRQTKLVFDGMKGKNKFPFSYSVEVPPNGYTKVRIFLDYEIMSEFVEDWSGSTKQ